MQIRTRTRYQLAAVRMAVIEETNAGVGTEGKETLARWWDWRLVQPLWDTVWKTFKKLKGEGIWVAVG